MRYIYYSVQLVLIFLVFVFNSLGYKLSYWLILMPFAVQLIQICFEDAHNKTKMDKLSSMFNDAIKQVIDILGFIAKEQPKKSYSDMSYHYNPKEDN